ncbi:MAG: aldehyde ferredoxin oxidoreductase family protein [Candidatus Nezhaarchaeota archaeon]|nr:aldehyde ferredoxin oxidoreductase family protein [Candidatus Nezhaarchaeota archaeon]MCX8141523.1 aldehyde ferredoxin oxidoreductase family protein [Candidatus Nezhaarchaeota archaeon]MDW8049790.1 aldehyde ferredoxin oxidoreductase family protein [Nitrososphaerota archaeon]
MKVGGYMGKIARIDLTKRSIKVQEPTRELVMDYIGGRGWGAKILWDEVPRGVDPLSPDNKVVIATGPVTGTYFTGTGKVTLCSKSPLTGAYGDSNVGGRFGVELKQAGFDALILEGVSSDPVYITIIDGDISIERASHLWGLGSIETEEALKRDLNDDYISCLTIGPAGENKVYFACVNSDFGRQAGRTGIGAVLGFKKVKAIVALGTSDIPVYDVDSMIEVAQEAYEYCFKSEAQSMWIRQGTMQLILWSNENSALPTRNMSDAIYEKAEMISGDAMEKRVKIGNHGCFGCAMPCGQLSKVKEGKYIGTVVEGPEYETAAMIGSNCALNSIEEVVWLNRICDELGLDSISTGSVIAFAIECKRRGLLKGVEADYGDADGIAKLIEDIVYRRGIGNLLAQGTKRVAEALGGDALKIAMQVKGLEISAYESRAAPAMALAYGTCDIGAHHNRAWAITYDIKVGRTLYTPDKARWVIYLQHVRSLFDMLTCCRLPWVELSLPLKYYERLYRAVTGIDYRFEDLLIAAERVYNLTRCFWLREYPRMDSSWDYPPPRWFEESLPSGPFKGVKLDRAEYTKLLMEYYKLRGWNEEGRPTIAKLKSLGLSFVINELMEAGVNLS